MSLTTQAEALAAALNAIVLESGNSLRTGSDLPAVVNPPFAFPSVGQITYDTMEDARTTHWTIVVLWSQSSTSGAQAGLRSLLDRDSDQSIKHAIELDQTLSGTVSDVHVEGSGPIQTYNVAGTDYLGAEVNIWTID